MNSPVEVWRQHSPGPPGWAASISHVDSGLPSADSGYRAYPTREEALRALWVQVEDLEARGGRAAQREQWAAWQAERMIASAVGRRAPFGLAVRDARRVRE